MNLTTHILEMIAQAEQDIHQELQQIPRDDRTTRAYIGMNRLTVLKNDIKELLTEGQEQSEPLYTANQPIWYDTGCGKLPSTFLEYVGMTVRIQHSMHPQSVYISKISPRDEKGDQR